MFAEEALLLPRNLRSKFIFLDSSMVERTAVNRDVVGSSPTRGASLYGSMVKRLRHRPFTAVTRVRFPSESFHAVDYRRQGLTVFYRFDIIIKNMAQ